MTDYQNDRNYKLLHEALAQLDLRFPVADIHRATGYAKGNISNFIQGKASISDNFITKLYEAFNLSLDGRDNELKKENNVKAIRVELGLTQEDLAKELGVSRKTIHGYENGEVIPPSKEKLLKMFYENKKKEKLPTPGSLEEILMKSIVRKIEPMLKEVVDKLVKASCDKELAKINSYIADEMEGAFNKISFNIAGSTAVKGVVKDGVNELRNEQNKKFDVLNQNIINLLQMSLAKGADATQAKSIKKV